MNEQPEMRWRLQVNLKGQVKQNLKYDRKQEGSILNRFQLRLRLIFEYYIVAHGSSESFRYS